MGTWMKMLGLRCTTCGETRWALLTIPMERSRECCVCGGEMLVERRRPGHGTAQAGERRTLPVALSSPRAGASRLGGPAPAA